jgi:hypothetical protein
MKNLELPPRKTFEQDFLTKDGKKLFTITYKQATLMEYFEYQWLTDDEKVLFIYGIIHNQCPLTKFEKILRILVPKWRGKMERNIDVWNVAMNIIANMFRSYKSIFEWSVSNNNSKRDEIWLPAFNLLTVCNEYSTPLQDLLENFTIEQYIWLMDWIIYKNNLQSKEWQFMNGQALKDKEAIKRRAEETRKAFNQ